MKIYILLFVSLVFISCHLENSEETLEKIPIYHIQVPENMMMGSEYILTFKYALENDCYSFYDVEIIPTDGGKTLTITTFAKVDDTGGVCTQEYSEETYSFTFKPIGKVSHKLRFWKGKDLDGNNLFEEIEFNVE